MTHHTEAERAIELAEKHGATSYRNRADTKNPAFGFTPSQLSALIADVEQAARRAPAAPVPQVWKQLTEAPRIGASAWTVLINNEPPVWGSCWSGSDDELENLRKGLVHATHTSAMAHAQLLAAAPQPPEAPLVPSIAVTPEMVEAANEAYCPFGDMELALCAALQVAPIPPGAAPVQLPENIREGEPYDNPAFEALARALGVWGTAQSAVCAQFWIAAKEQST